MMALAGVELETLVSEPDALTTRPPPCALITNLRLTNSLVQTSLQLQFFYETLNFRAFYI